MQYVSEATYFTDISKFHNIWSPSLKIIAKITHCNLNSCCTPLHILFSIHLPTYCSTERWNSPLSMKQLHVVSKMG